MVLEALFGRRAVPRVILHEVRVLKPHGLSSVRGCGRDVAVEGRDWGWLFRLFTPQRSNFYLATLILPKVN